MISKLKVHLNRCKSNERLIQTALDRVSWVETRMKSRQFDLYQVMEGVDDACGSFKAQARASAELTYFPGSSILRKCIVRQA
jgi:hypothetical protein